MNSLSNTAVLFNIYLYCYGDVYSTVETSMHKMLYQLYKDSTADVTSHHQGGVHRYVQIWHNT